MLTSHQLREFKPKKTLGLKIDAILSAPLIAASNANAMMLKEQTKFMMDFCFVKRGKVYDPVLIEMSLTRTVLEPSEFGEELRIIKTVFMLPIMTIIPINSLAVNSIELDFEMEITSQSERNIDQQRMFSDSSERNFEEHETILRGKVGGSSSKETTKSKKESSTTKLAVHMEAGTLPLPIGVSTLLDLYVKSIQPVEKIKKEKKRKKKHR